MNIFPFSQIEAIASTVIHFAHILITKHSTHTLCAEKNKTVMKRQIEMKFIKPKSMKFSTTSSDKLVAIQGRISEIVYPKALETYAGHAIVKINGRTVVGNLPFLDKRLVYNLICSVINHPRFGAQYEIVDYADEPFAPIDINFQTLKLILMEDYGMGEFYALECVCELKDSLGYKSILDKVEASVLVHLDSPTWLTTMCADCPLFKHEYLSKLSLLWSPRILVKLPLKLLCDIADQLRRDPTVFCYSWKNSYPVPEVKADKIVFLERVSGKNMSDQTKSCVRTYNHVTAWMNNRSRITFTDQELVLLGEENRRFAVKNRIFQPIQERFGDTLHKRWYIRKDFELLLQLKKKLTELFARTKDGPLLEKQPNVGQLNAPQKAAYDAVLGVNLVIIQGDAGTGKTEVGRCIAKRYRKKSVLPLACYGRVASMLQSKFGRGFTIHKVITLIEKKTKVGAKLVKYTRVLIIDEVSTLTLELFVRLLCLFPKLLKIVMIGDEKQMPPVERGAIFEALLAKYRSTAVVHTLTDVLRVTEESRLLLNNFNRIIAGETDLEFSDDIHSDHPFVLMPRETVPRQLEGKAGGVAIIKRTFERLLEAYEHTDVQILTQKNSVRGDINRAMFELTRDNTDIFTHSSFYVNEKVMFTENNYGNIDGPEHTRSTAVMNGEVRTISSIYDVDPTDDPVAPVQMRCTDDPKRYPAWHRMIEFTDGGRVNLRHYDISNISKGNASSVSMAQGSEFNNVAFYIHDNISRTLTHRELYTAVTRAKRRVIIIGRLEELIRIILNRYESPESTIENWLPELRADVI